MFRQCRAWSSWRVCTRRCDISAAFPDQRKRCPVGRHPYSYGIHPSGRFIRHDFALRQNHGQRAGPECICKPHCCLRDVRYDLFQIFKTADMNDQRIIRRTALCFINIRSRLCLKRIRTQTIHRLCRKRHKTAWPENLARLPDHLRIYVWFINFCYNCCLHTLSFLTL